MGKLVLRSNNHIKDFDKWFKHIKEIYAERTSLDFIDRHKTVSFFVLNQSQYLADIIDDLDWKKESNLSFTCHPDSKLTEMNLFSSVKQ